MDRSSQLSNEKISTLLFKFSLPAVIAMLVNAIYNVVDRIFIGQGVGSLGIAGVAIGFPIMLLVMAFAMLIGIGATSLISIKLGEENVEEAELILANGTVLLILVSLLISVIGLVFLNPLLKLFGASDAVLPYAREYMQIVLLGTVFMATGFGMNNFIRAEGNPMVAMYTMLVGAGLNIILNPIFIFGLGWGIRGAAVATVLSRAVSTAWILYYFLSGRSLLRIRMEKLKIYWPVVSKILAIGAAPFSMQLANSMLQVVLNNSLRIYGGDVAIAGMGVVFSILTLMFMPVIGITQGAQPIIGFNYGAHNFDRVKETLKQATLAATGVMVVGFLLIRISPEAFIALFNEDDVQLMQFGSRALLVFLAALPVIGFQIVGANYFQAVGKPKQSMILTLSRQVLLLIPLLLILPRFYGLDGVLYSGPIADLGSAVITGIWLFAELRSLNAKQDAVEISRDKLT